MSPEDAEEFTSTVEMIGAGWWRQIAWADRQGIPAALGLTTRQWVEQRIGGYVRLAVPDRREAVAELTAEGMTQRDVAEVLGVDAATVNRDLRQPVADATPGATDQARRDATAADATTPTAEEIERAQRERDIAAAVRRQAMWLRATLEGWDTIVHLAGNPLRDPVLAELSPHERQRVLSIEEAIRS